MAARAPLRARTRGRRGARGAREPPVRAVRLLGQPVNTAARPGRTLRPRDPESGPCCEPSAPPRRARERLTDPVPPEDVPPGARRSGRAATSGQDEAHTPAGATGDSGAGGWSSPRDSIASAVPGLVLRSGISDSQGSVLTGLAACAVTKVNEHLFSAHCVPRLLRLPAPGRLLGVQSVQWHRPCAQKGLTLGLTPCCPTLEILSDF